MIKELIDHLKKYDEQRKSVEAEFAKAKKDLDKTYNPSGDQYRILLEKATKEKDSSVQDLNEGILDMVNSAFNTANDRLTEYVTVPIPAEMATILETVRMMKDSLSAEEVRIFQDAVSKNYLANLRMGHILGDAHGVRYDEVKANLDEQQSLILNWINYFNPDSYSHEVLLQSENNSLIECDQMITSFLKGKV